MSILNLNDLRIQVNNDIKTNGVRSITGVITNKNLIDMIDSIESDYDIITDGLDVRVTDIESSSLLILQDKATGWDASSGSFPGGGTAKAGYYWNVSTAGTVDGVYFDLGDSLLAVVDNASTSTYAANWSKKDDIDTVISVAGKVGAITLDAADITDFDTEVSNNVDVAANSAKVSNVTTNLSEGASTTTTVNVDSSDGTNATLQPASTIRAGVMSKAKFDEVEANNAKVSNVSTNLSTSLSATEVTVESSDGLDVVIGGADSSDAGILTSAKFDEIGVNNSKVTNATHTGEIFGSGALTAQPTLISNKTLVTAVGTDHVLIGDASDSDNLKKVLVSDFLGGGANIYTADGTLTANRTVDLSLYDLTFLDGKTTFKGSDQLGTSSALLIEDSAGNDLLDVKNDGDIGVGISSPLNRLHVNSTNAVEDMVRLSKSGVTQSILGYYNSGGYLQLQNATGLTAKVQLNVLADDFINTGFNFGVGTDSPAYKLHVNSTNATEDMIQLSKSGAPQAYLGYYNSGGYLQLQDAAGTTIKARINGIADDYINTGFNFGVGTDSPAAKLHVVGDVRIDDTTTTGKTISTDFLPINVNGTIRYVALYD
jgi:hypothetical protein